MSIHPDDYDIDAIRTEWINKVVSKSDCRYLVEYDAIGRYCHMTGNMNPLFLDPDCSSDHGPHGAIIVPSSSLPLYFASGGPLPRATKPAASAEDGRKRPGFTLGIRPSGDRGVNMGTDW